MLALLVAAALPGLYWDGPVDTAEALRKAGIERLYVSPASVKTWRAHGFDASAFDRANATTAVAPGVEARIGVASATHDPWINANGWRFARQPDRSYFYEARMGSAALAAAEAFAYRVEAAVRVMPEDLAAFASMLNFLHHIDQPALPTIANIGVIDDGSPQLGEAMNLMARHNLLFQVVRAPDPKYDVLVRNAADAADARQRLGDDNRWLRIFGSSVVLARLTGDGAQVRLHLLNYGGATVRGLRVRLRGVYRHPKLAALGIQKPEVRDLAAEDGATEFTIPEMQTYAVVDLSAGE